VVGVGLVLRARGHEEMPPHLPHGREGEGVLHVAALDLLGHHPLAGADVRGVVRGRSGSAGDERHERETREAHAAGPRALYYWRGDEARRGRDTLQGAPTTLLTGFRDESARFAPASFGIASLALFIASVLIWKLVE
jgi:hypothetical protein